MKKILFLFLMPLGLLGQMNLTGSSGSVTESFTGYLGTSTLSSNWTTSGTGANGNNFSGSNQTGGTSGGWYGNDNMSYLGSGSASNGNATWRLRNLTGAPITSLTITFDARLWRSNANSPTVSVSYSTNSTGTVPAAGGLTALSSLTFSDATASITTGTSLTQTLTGLSIANNDYIYLRFIHSGGSNSDNLGWDNVKIDYSTCTPPSNPIGSISQTNNCGSVDLAYSGTPTNIYWQTSDTGTSLASPVSSNLNMTATGTRYARAYDGTSCWSTGTVSSTVSSVPNNSTISSQPSNSSISNNSNTSFTVLVTSNPTYQWQVNTGSGFTNISNGGVYSGATSATLSITGASLSMSGYTYQCIVTSPSPCTNVVTSNSALLTVSAAPVLYTFDGGSGTSSATNPTGISNLTFGSLSQGNNNGTTTLVTNTSSSSGYSNVSGNYNAGAAANTGAYSSSSSAYFEFTISPATNYGVEVSNISLGARSTGTGPTSIDIRSSLDGYATIQGTLSYTANSIWTLISSGVSILSYSRSPLTIRLYGIGGSGSPGANNANWRIDDLSVTARAVGVCNSSISGSSLSSLTEQCTDSASWIYYGNSSNNYFAINKNGNSFTPTVDITVSSSAVDSSKSSNGANQEHGSYLMKRYWNVSCTGCSNLTTNGGVSVRFFYDPADSTAARTAMRNGFTALKASNTTTLADTTMTMQWIKTNGVPYAPSNFTGNKMTQPHTKLTPIYGTLNGIRYVQFDNITSFSGGGGGFGFGPSSGGGGVGLPVTWAGFDVKTLEIGNELTWKTASEQNTDYFEIEYSYDARQWLVISEKIAAAGNSADWRTYRYTHGDFAPFTYYRIKQMDIDGKFDYSAIKLAKRMAGPSFLVSVFPIPMENDNVVNVAVKGIDKSSIRISMTDITGKVIRNISSTPTSEVVKESFDMSPLAPGIYFIEVQNGQGKEIIKVSR